MDKISINTRLENEATKTLNTVKKELDAIHNELFSGKVLSNQFLRELLAKVIKLNNDYQKADDNLLTLFMKYREQFDKYEGIYNYAVGMVCCFGITMFFRPVVSFLFISSLVAVYHMRKAIKTYEEFTSRDDAREFCYEEIRFRIQNYLDVLKARVEKCQEGMLDSKDGANLDVVNEWIKLAVDEEVELDYIPGEIKQEMLEVLKFELHDSSDNLGELIGIVRGNLNQNIGERGRYLKK